GPGFVTVYPCGSARPLASNLNFTPGTHVPNAVMSLVGQGGAVCFYAQVDVHLVVDVEGYFGPGSPYSSLVPARLLDTRAGSPTIDGEDAGGGKIPGGGVLQLQVTGRGGVPADATAVALNVTATNGVGPGFVTVFPCGASQPLASNLNFVAGEIIPNLVLIGP